MGIKASHKIKEMGFGVLIFGATAKISILAGSKLLN